MSSRRVWCPAALRLLLPLTAYVGLSTAAAAAEIVDVLVSPRGDFSEVVLELDKPAGYRLERARTGFGQEADEVLIAIDAEASERRLETPSGLVTGVTVYDGGKDPALIRIGLREPGLVVRDSVLVNPPRLVLRVSHRGGAEAEKWPQIPAAPVAVAPAKSPGTAAAGAGSLRDVRVGSHPTFSRLVFELDAPATYHLVQQDASELLITLGAASDALRVRSKSRYIESVQVEAGNAQTVARVRLKGSGLRIRDLTLSNPDRIVIDVESASLE